MQWVEQRTGVRETLDEGLLVITRTIPSDGLPLYRIHRKGSDRVLAEVSVFRCDREFAVTKDSSIVSFPETFTTYSGLIDAGLHASRQARVLLHYFSIKEGCGCDDQIRTDNLLR